MVDQVFKNLSELGAELKATRSARGLDVQAMSTMTCIRIPLVEAIESGNFPPNWSWADLRGLVRSYINVIQRQDLWPFYDRLLSDVPPVTHKPANESSDLFKEVSPFAEESEGAEQGKADGEGAERSETERREAEQEDGKDVADGGDGELPSGRRIAHPLPQSVGLEAPQVKPHAQTREEPAVPRRVRRQPLTEEQALAYEEAESVKVPPRPRRSRVARPEYEARDETPTPPVGPSPAPRARRVPRSNSPLLMNELGRADEERPRKPFPFGGLLILLVTLLVLGLLGFLIWRGASALFGRHDSAPTPAAVTATSPADEDLGALVVSVPQVKPLEGASDKAEVPAEGGAAVKPAPAPAPAAESAVASSKGKLAFRVKGGECWIQVRKGGKNVFAKVVKDGEEGSVDLDGDLTVQFGAAQHVMISVDGGDWTSPGEGVLNATYKAVR